MFVRLIWSFVFILGFAISGAAQDRRCPPATESDYYWCDILDRGAKATKKLKKDWRTPFDDLKESYTQASGVVQGTECIRGGYLKNMWNNSGIALIGASACRLEKALNMFDDSLIVTNNAAGQLTHDFLIRTEINFDNKVPVNLTVTSLYRNFDAKMGQVESLIISAQRPLRTYGDLVTKYAAAKAACERQESYTPDLAWLESFAQIVRTEIAATSAAFDGEDFDTGCLPFPNIRVSTDSQQ